LYGKYEGVVERVGGGSGEGPGEGRVRGVSGGGPREGSTRRYPGGGRPGIRRKGQDNGQDG